MRHRLAMIEENFIGGQETKLSLRRYFHKTANFCVFFCFFTNICSFVTSWREYGERERERRVCACVCVCVLMRECFKYEAFEETVSCEETVSWIALHDLETCKGSRRMKDGFQWGCQGIEIWSCETWQCIWYRYRYRYIHRSAGGKGNSEKMKKERQEDNFWKLWGSKQDVLKKQWELSIKGRGEEKS